VLRGGSVPGRVTQSAGGVARNVTEALALLIKTAGMGAGAGGGQLALPLPLLVSAVGDDLAGQALLQHWKSLG
jgi:sugar/nucleoside kinase (ribokinase family)